MQKAVTDQQTAQKQSDTDYQKALEKYNSDLVNYQKTLSEAQSVQFGKNGPILDARHKSHPLTVATVDPNTGKITAGQGDEAPVGDVIKTGNDINQGLAISADNDAKVNATIDPKYQAILTCETGNDSDYKAQGVSTFAPQGNYHSIVFKSAETGNNTNEIADHFADITFDNLHGSSYQGTPITKIVISFSNLKRKGTAKLEPNKGVSPDHYGKHAVVIYDDITRGFQFSGVSVDVTYTFYDSQGNQINFDSNKNNAWFTPFSLNNHGNYIEAVHSLDSENIQPARLMGSSIKPHLKGEFNADADGEYADNINDGVQITFNYDKENPEKSQFEKWDNSESDDPKGLRTFGSGLYHVKGNQIKLRFFMINNNQDFNYKTVKSGSMAGQPQWTYGSTWTGISTNIPHYSQAPAKPVKKGDSVSVVYYDNDLKVPGSVTYIVEPGAEGSGVTNNRKDPYSFTNSVKNGNYTGWKNNDVILPYINPGYSFYDEDGNRLAGTNDKVLKSYLDAHAPNQKIYIKANAQTANISYIDDTTNTVLDSDKANGKFAQAINFSKTPADQIKAFENQNYVLVSNNFDNNNFDSDNAKNVFEVHFVHGVEPVTPNTPNDQVPKTPDGGQLVNPTELTKTVTLTVTYKNDDKTDFTGHVPQNAIQTVTFIGTAYVDKVTGQLVNAKQEKDQWVADKDNSAAPQIKWTPAQSFKMVVSPSETNYHLTEVSDYADGNNVAAIPNITKDSSDIQVTVTYAPNGQIIPVDPQGNPIPNAPTPQYPTDPTDPSKVTPNEPVPSIPGYTPEVPTVTPDQPGKDTKVIYRANEQKAQVTFIDDTTGKTIQVKQLTGHTGETDPYRTTADIQALVNQGYELVSDDYPTNGVTYDHDDQTDQQFEVHLKHTTTTVTPKKPGQPGQPVDPQKPNGPHYPSGTDLKQLSRLGTQIVHYVVSDGKVAAPADKTQNFTFTREITFDNVTGKLVETTPWNATSHTFGEETTPFLAGYHADQSSAGSQTVTPDDLTKEVTVTYAPNGHIIPVDPQGNPIPGVPTPQYPTDPTDPSKVTPNEPVPSIPGYTPEVPTVTPNQPGKDTKVVYVKISTPVKNDGKTNPPSDIHNDNDVVPTKNVEAKSTTSAPKATTLPQTGNEQSRAGIIGLALVSVATMLGLGKKRKEN